MAQTTPDALLTSAFAKAAQFRNLPESTYRLQFHKDFTFRDATKIVPYLAALGVTHVYCSPYLKARPGSTHGYDVIDHCSLNPELGTQADFDAFLAALKQHNLSHILDTVPNHVGVATNDNKWWNDVLEHGRASKYAHYFDIDWDSPHAHLKGKLLLPLLGTTRDQAIASGDLRLSHEDGRPFVRYYDRRFPINPDTHNLIDGPLDKLLDAQHYLLDEWRSAAKQINYRRFFDINDLAGLAIEHEDVFEATQNFTLSLCVQGHVTGLRIDHPDGLYDPAQYLRRLQTHYLLSLAQSLYKGDNWPAARQQLLSRLGTGNWEPGTPLYVTVEKILAPHEPLPADWPVAGTSGYDPLNEINLLFVDPKGEQPLTDLYRSFTGDTTPFEDLVYQKKLLILDTSLASELHTLTRRLERIAQSDPTGRQFTFQDLHAALRQLVACFPVYRTYITDEGPHTSDRPVVEATVRRATERNPDTNPSLFRFVRDVLLLNNADQLTDDAKHARLRFAGKFQQLTAPTTAKGIEDTSFYIYQRLISLNEVGGEPTRFGVSPEELHAYFARRARHHPHALTPLSTHDTKRSEDVRARLNVLSELPAEWRENVERWRTLNAKHKRGDAPAADEEYLLYQTLLGAWEEQGGEENGDGNLFAERIQAYMRKALRESKLRTSWTSPDERHESAVNDFVTSVLRSEEFLSAFGPFRQRVARVGFLNSLSQTTLRLTAPGVPDTYQGTELLDLSLVDPDNRRPVDYSRRADLLSNLPPYPSLSTDPNSLKLLVTAKLLHARRSRPGLFTGGTYAPLRPAGRFADNLFAFTRQHGNTTAVVLLPRLTTHLGDAPVGAAWQDTNVTLPKVSLRNLLTNEPVPANTATVSRLLSSLPVAVFLST
jgi:(1->4)-alpha-D-glucan 1-alpha-D-glucosylmutase